MSKFFHIVVALLTYQTGMWLLQTHEAGNGGYFHFAATILVGMIFCAQIHVLIDEASEIVNLDKDSEIIDLNKKG
jgi:hypothetical protein